MYLEYLQLFLSWARYILPDKLASHRQAELMDATLESTIPLDSISSICCTIPVVIARNDA